MFMCEANRREEKSGREKFPCFVILLVVYYFCFMVKADRVSVLKGNFICVVFGRRNRNISLALKQIVVSISDMFERRNETDIANS